MIEIILQLNVLKGVEVMPRSEKQKLKLYYVIEIFKRYTDEEHPVSITEIIKYLAEVGIKAERKSIYRDFAAMELLGYQIVAVHNKHFKYYLGNRKFKSAELRLLVDAVQSSRFITKKKSNELIRKLEGLTTVHDAERLQTQVFVANRVKSLNESIYMNVDRIHYAIQDNCKISFVYFDWDVNKRKKYRRDGERYITSPWALIWNNENYYLVGYDSDSKQLKHYRVDRMMMIEMENLRRDGRKMFSGIDVAEYSRQFFGMYNGEVVPVTLRCGKSVTNAVIDKFGSDVKFEPSEDGEYFDVTVEVAVTPVFLSWVFMFGGQVKIIEPDSAAIELKKMMENVMESIDIGIQE